MTSYGDEYAAFRIECPERFNPVLDIVGAWAREDPEAPALISLDGAGEVVAEHTVAQVAEEADRAARVLADLGIGKGDRVLVMLPRVPAWYWAILGAIRIGAVPMPTPNQSTGRDLSYRLRAAGAAAVITGPEGAGKVEAIGDALPEVVRLLAAGEEERREGWEDLGVLMAARGKGELPARPTAATDPQLLFFTSGTVSAPKMVPHDQAYALGHIRTARFWQDLRAGDRHWTVSDTGWAKAAWGGLFGQWHERATVVQVDLGRPDAETILGILARRRITSFCAPPTLYRLLVQGDLAAHDLSSLRHCTSAGEPLNPEVIRAWKEGTGGLTVYDGYGQTENTALVANYRCLPIRPGSMGKPTPGYRVSVVDDAGDPVPAGTVGEVVVGTDPHPIGLFHGYLENPEENAEAFRDGWYHTGDKAKVDEDGYFWFEGRSDDVITSSAYRIGPFEVESALVEHPAVVEAAVVGRDDPERTQIVCAFVILASGVVPSEELTEELQEHAKRTTAPYKYPREIHYVEELPKTISGKIRRGELRERLAAEAGRG